MSSGMDLAVDFGTSNTAALLRRSDGRIQSVLFDGSPLLPSAVCREPSGRLLVGQDAVAGARMYPGSAELNPKRCVDDGELLLGGTGIPVADAVAAVLRRALDEAGRAADGHVFRVVLSHPVTWGPRRRAVLLSAAERAGIDEPVLVGEPVAAAAAFVARSSTAVAVGEHVLVYDFGGGTFDASVVVRTPDGFEVRNAEGLDDAGGLDIDAAIVANLGAAYAERDLQAWRRIEEPQAAADHRARRQLWDDVRAAKEMLSRTTHAIIHVPAVGDDWPIGREQLERIARPVLNRTVACARSAVLNAGLAPHQLKAVLLVGGSSRIPLVATLLHRTFGIPPINFDQPEMVVVEGAILTTRRVPTATTSETPGPPTPAPPLTALEPPPAAAPAGPDAPLPDAPPSVRADSSDTAHQHHEQIPEPPHARRRGRRTAVIAASAAVAALGAVAVISNAAGIWGDKAGGYNDGGSRSANQNGLHSADVQETSGSGAPGPTKVSESARPGATGSGAAAPGTSRPSDPAGSASPAPPAGGSTLDISTNYAWARGSVSWNGTEATANGAVQDTAQYDTNSWLRIAYRLNIDGVWKLRYAQPDPFVSVSNGQNKEVHFSLRGPVKDVQWDLCSNRLGTTYCTGWS